jgi:hypothetical protein
MGPDLIPPTHNFRIGTKFVVTMATTTPLRLQAASLREWVLSQTAKDVQSSTTVPTTFKVVDVRDDDFVGGSIPGTINIPSRRFGSRVDSLVDELKDNEAVVFTCALSQQRGPNVIAL